MHPGLIRATDDRGLLMRSAALAAGCDDVDLRRAVRGGQLRRLRAGTYVVTSRWEGLGAREQHVLLARGVVLKAGTEVVLSHVSAVALHGGPLWQLPLDDVHLTRTDQRGGRHEAGVVQHRGALAPGHVEERDGVTVTSPARTAMDLVGLVGVERSLPVLDDFLRRRLTTRTELDACRRWMETWPHSLVADLSVRLADGLRESVGESRTAYCFYLGGVPRPQLQWPVLDESGAVVARLDFAWPWLGVWVEFDGKEKYLKHRRPGESVVDAVLREKRRKERISRLTGWRCIRLTWADLFHPEATAAYVLSVLSGGPVHAAKRTA
ncbi:hypothetical protein ASG49_00825 [Marmoricola sp. Leaf446]|uniref:hypothetical protein n=1 Tax=Marmoricola sp. Leaf446 TaxID=1736379 RepID=UPI0006F6330B|nr:hypothetical protein [Marmoricola sp. Leaf446]KQT93583.1 hypothetical protein ASG49_00825 [Marmoricola sp. Leaf446]